MYSQVSVEARTALEQSKAVSKINDLTKNILDIAEQTSLLALNANIEAAKSGKYGKGFAVVAKEISNTYHEDAESFQSTLEEITHSLKSFEVATNDIAMAISGITVTISESSEGIVTIADRSTEVVNLSDNTYNQVKLNGKMADTLQSIVDKFRL